MKPSTEGKPFFVIFELNFQPIFFDENKHMLGFFLFFE